MKKNVIKSICLISILFLICSTLAIFGNKSVALAEGSEKEAKLVSPATPIEYNEVINPSFISYADNKIFLTDNSTNLTIFDLVKSEKKIFPIKENNSSRTPIKAMYNESLEKVLVKITNDDCLYTLDISSANSQLETIMYDSKTLALKNFDISNDKIIGIYGTFLRYFKKEANNEYLRYDISKRNNDTNNSICVDGKNVFFSKDGNNLYLSDIISNEEKEPVVFIEDFIPNIMISNGEYLFYVLNNEVYKKSIKPKEATKDTTEETPLKATSESSFKLGSLGTINSICLKDENLLIASTFENGKSAIQEFAVENDKLVFTGFAISKGNSAFNRIEKDALDIEKSGNNIAVIDSKKITLINKTSDIYAYQNILLNGDLTGANKIALGKDKILVASDNSYSFIKLDTLQIEETKTLANIQDLVFANGKFYISTCDGANSVIYKLNDSNLEEIKRFDQVVNNFTIKADGEILTSDSKILTDLVGKEFTLQGGKLDSYSLQGYTQNIKSFAMDIESKEIYFLLENEELILSSTAFDNKSISQIIVGSDYKVTDSNAQSIDSLKVYSINENTNVYKIKIDSENKITYQGLTNDYKGEFVRIYCLENGYGNFSILSGYNKTNNEILVLVDNQSLSINSVTEQVEKCEAVISTPVDMYYLPLINYDRSFSLYDGDYIRLSRGEKITYEYQSTINGKIFLYGEVTRNGKTIKGYVPKDFTIENFASNYINQTIKKDTVEAQGNNFKIIICLFILSTIVFVTTIYFVFIRKHDVL